MVSDDIINDDIINNAAVQDQTISSSSSAQTGLPAFTQDTQGGFPTYLEEMNYDMNCDMSAIYYQLKTGVESRS